MIKTFLAGLSLLVCLAVSSPAPALESAAVKFKDVERGTEVELYGIRAGFLMYVNEKYDYSVWVPVLMAQKVVLIADNDDGLIMESSDGLARFRASGGLAEFVEGGLKGSFDRAVEEAGSGLIDKAFTGGPNGHWVVNWRNGDFMHHRKFVTKGDNWFDCELSYPAGQAAKYERSVEGVMSETDPINKK